MICWDVHDQDAFRAKHAVKFAQRCRIIIEMIEHVRRDNRVKKTVLEWKRGNRTLSQVGGCTASFPRQLEGLAAKNPRQSISSLPGVVPVAGSGRQFHSPRQGGRPLHSVGVTTHARHGRAGHENTRPNLRPPRAGCIRRVPWSTTMECGSPACKLIPFPSPDSLFMIVNANRIAGGLVGPRTAASGADRLLP